MESHLTEIFSRLGRRLTALAGSVDAAGNVADTATGEVIRRAVAANPWFTPADISRAALAIADDMLSPQPFSQWLSLYSELPEPSCRRNVLIIMAGNIPFVGLGDLVCTLATGHRAIVKPSSKDTVLMSWAVAELLDIESELPVSLVSELSGHKEDNPLPAPDAVIAMGGNEAVAAIRERYAWIPLLLRGSRSSVAVLDGRESPAELNALADDVLSYSGLGCRNVSLVFVPRGYDFSELQNIMSERQTSLNIKYRNNYRQALALLRMSDTPYIDAYSCLLVEKRDFPNNISIINYSHYDSLYEVTDWLNDHNVEIQCIAAHSRLVHPRTVVLGQTQHPRLSDYPDGLDTMGFLRSLSRPALIVIAGPTGSGKTDLAIELATRLGTSSKPVPIISTDSRQVYRGMKIGSAQPSDAQLAAVPHYFIADRPPTERFTCADFESEALMLLEKLFATERYVIAVGGSGLYLDALTGGLDALPDVNPDLRNELNDRLSREGLGPLLEELREKDPEYYGSVDKQNPARVLRALEVCRQTGKPFSSLRTGTSLHTNTKAARPFEVIKIGIDLPRPELYERIDRRVDAMMEAGLEAEARNLHHLSHLPALQTVGYRELFEYFNGECSLARAVELIKRNSRRYAKRQLTWFRRDPAIAWFHPSDPAAIFAHITKRDII